MRTVCFTKNAGSYQKDKKYNFNDTLADFFVSKLKAAEYVSSSLPEQKISRDEDLRDFLVSERTIEAPSKSEVSKRTKRQYNKRSKYKTRELKAEE